MSVQAHRDQTIETQSTPIFSLLRTLRLSSFEIGSAMSDILTASVWNRIMIVELGMPATPVNLLLALQYILIPITLWAGHSSDTRPLFGRRRLSYIWSGRFLMLIGFLLLGMSIFQFDAGANGTGWLMATIAFLIFGSGKLMSGSIFLTLVRESAPPDKQGIAIGIVETTLIALFPVMAIGFGRYMETYSAERFWQLILLVMIVGGFFWWFATVGQEEPAEHMIRREHRPIHDTFGKIWGDARTRLFFFFLGFATFAAWMQDGIMEPFGAEVFNLDVGVTTRFTGYWGTATVLVILICFATMNKRLPETLGPITSRGLIVMGSGMLLLAFSSMQQIQPLIIPALLLYGVGFGVYTFGGLSLMAVMSPSSNAGAFLSLWTLCILLFKGGGTFLGGFLRDLFISLANLSPNIGYGAIFAISGLGLLATTLLLGRINIPAFKRDYA